MPLLPGQQRHFLVRFLRKRRILCSGKASAWSAPADGLGGICTALAAYGRNLALDVCATAKRATNVAVVIGWGHFLKFAGAIPAGIFVQGHIYLRSGWSESSSSKHSWSLSLMHSTSRVFMLFPVHADKIFNFRCVSSGNRSVSCFVGPCSFSDTCLPRLWPVLLMGRRYIKM